MVHMLIFLHKACSPIVHACILQGDSSFMPASTTTTEKPRHALFPIFLDLAGKTVLVVGGGQVATRKVQALLDTGADVCVGAPELDPLLQENLAQKKIRYLSGKFTEAWLDNVWLVIAATDERATNLAISQAAQARRIWVNVVDDAPISSFQSPARVQRGPLQIAISSGGTAPMLARHVRETLETQFDPAYGTLAQLFEDLRSEIRAALPDLTRRRAFFDSCLQGDVLHWLRSNDLEKACAQLRKLLLVQQQSARVGRVALVGAGPGDPGLLTLRALRVLNLADVILSDELVSSEVLALARRDAEVIFVGKRGGGHCTAQSDIHAQMQIHAQSGKFVVRLKGGDPFVFGRGGEELQFLATQGIPFEVVPGITAALACAAYSGVPLTHRDCAQSVRLLTAHCKQSLDTLDWQALAQERQTLAVYMGINTLQRLQQQLQRFGRDANTPFAIVENGSRAEQRVIVGTLGELQQLAQRARVQSPSLLIIGEVAALANSLHWFAAKPLSRQDFPELQLRLAA
jgi:uroporphyrin-III C-methyltransferase / precorrin-2 dehydrogenase / sirohydrochlorin ferrochelatase